MNNHLVHILLVEAEDSCIEIIIRAFSLRMKDARLTIVRSLAEAGKKLFEYTPDLVIADLFLPDGKGRTFLLEGKENLLFPTIMIGDHGNEREAVEIMKAGALDYIVKTDVMLNEIPFIAEKVLREWRDILERKKSNEGLKCVYNLLRLEKRKLEQVLNIDQRISSILNLNHLVDFIIEKATLILGAEKSSLMLLDTDSQELIIRGAKGMDDEIVKTARVKIGERISGQVAKEGEALFITDIEDDSRVLRKNGSRYKGKSFLSVPIRVHDRVIGVVNVSDKKSSPKNKRVFTQTDLKIICAIVRQAAVAIENASYCRDLKHLSVTDAMTGLFNHRYFIKILEEEIKRVQRYQNSLCLLMIDIDNLKYYNDLYGHLWGDRLLKSVSKIFKGNLRDVDIICRYAGDEFVVVLSETNFLQAQVVAEKIKDKVSGINLKGIVTLSIGISQWKKGMDRRSLITKADKALYQAKREGKNRICCFH